METQIGTSMSNIRFLCPECSARLSVESGDVHLFIDCPHCHKHIRAWGSRLLDIKFSCPDCGKKMVIDASAAGCFVDCPGCSKTLKIPANEPVPHPAPSEASPNITRTAGPSTLLTSDEIAFLAGSLE